MTYRERREARAERLRGWADKRKEKAAATFKQGEQYRGDYAFNTQPGHIPERARLIAREDRAYQSLNKADSMAHKADEIERQANNAIYSDDEDAIERLRERITDLEARQERMRRANRDFKKGATIYDVDYLTDEDKADLLSVAKYQPYYMKNGLRFPPYALSNNNGNLRRNKLRLASLEAKARVHVALAAEQGAGQ